MRFRFHSLAALGGALTALLACHGAFAADGVATLVVTRSVAVELGAQQSPVVRDARAPVAAVPAIRESAQKLLPYAPRLTAVGGRRHGAFGSGLEIGGGVIQDFSLRGVGGARRDLASALEQSTATQLERAKLEGAAQALLAWLDVLEAQQLGGLRARARADAEEIARVANARVQRGAAMPMEAALASAEVGAALLGERDAEGRLVESRLTLLLALGLPPTRAVIAEGDLDTESGEPAAPKREHPAATAARAQIVVAQTDARLARAQTSPTLGLGVNYMREGTGEQLVTGTVSLPLPVFDPSKFEGARQQANVFVAEANARRMHEQLAHDVAFHAHERVHMREVRDTLRDRVLVPLRETVRQARASYQAGTQDATGLLLLRQRLVLAEEQLAHAAAEARRADVRYALARGTLLEEGGR